MAAFMYVAATIDTTNTVITGPEQVELFNPSVIELYARAEFPDIARRYRRLKSVADTDTVVVVPVTEGYHIDRRTILTTLGGKFSYATLTLFTIGAQSMLSDTMYIESGLGIDDLTNYIPFQYRTMTKRTTLNLAIDQDKVNGIVPAAIL